MGPGKAAPHPPRSLAPGWGAHLCGGAAARILLPTHQAECWGRGDTAPAALGVLALGSAPWAWGAGTDCPLALLPCIDRSAHGAGADL